MNANPLLDFNLYPSGSRAGRKRVFPVAFKPARSSFEDEAGASLLSMGNTNSDNPSDNEWEDRGELVWNEFDWERYLREQDGSVLRYLALYDRLRNRPERLDEAARQMGWGLEEWSSEAIAESGEIGDGEDAPEEPVEVDLDDEDEPYTLHKNPIYVATKALFFSLKQGWETTADDPSKVPQKLALVYHATLLRTEDQAMQAISALDFGDYAMAISLFKRALRDLNLTLGVLAPAACAHSRPLADYREDALPRLFDLREVWLRVMGECRDELSRPSEDSDEEGDE